VIKRRPLAWLWLNIAVKDFGLVFVALCGASALFWSTPTYCLEISVPDVAISSRDFEYASGAEYQPDASISVLNTATLNTWILPMWDKAHGGIVHVKSQGTVNHPLFKIEWIKKKNELFTKGKVALDGNFWIVNTLETEKGILAFIHVENAEGSGIAGGAGKSRIGLGWSDDNGDTFTFLGHIIVPFNDPDPYNIQGAPYIVKNKYIYIYFHDTTGLTVARAPLAEVISAAQMGNTSPWMKYDGQERGFNSNGAGGASTRIGIDGISHTDAACSTYNNKCYLLLTRMNWKGKDTWVKLYESVDGVSWKFSKTIVQMSASQVKAGYQYATIVNEDGSDNGVVGSKFFIYCNKDHQKNGRRTYKWTVDLAR